MPSITDKFGRASIVTDVAIATTVKTTRVPGVNVLEAIDLSKYAPDTPVFVVTYKKTTDPLTGVATITQLRSWKALVNTGANTLTNLTIQPGYADDIGNAVGDFIECIPTSAWENSLIDGILTSLNPDGTLKTSAVQAALGLVNNPSAGWTPLGVTQSGTIVHNGNRSYDVPFASSVAAILSPGMRLLLDKTVAGNAYMGGAFNGTSHYFTKTLPTGALGTVTNNFTLEWCGTPTAYQQAAFCGRVDPAFNNGFLMRMESDGRVTVMIANGGGANFRSVTTQQSLPLNKKIHVSASWSSGTVVIYFDGVSVPVAAASTGGTAPTTSGTGGDFSIGRPGAYAGQYFSGYASNCAVFDAVLSASTIKQHATYKLTGSEPNCIGAWSLDNTGVNQQSPGTNDVTATGGVGFTAMSPHGQLGDGVQASKAIGLVMAVNGSTVTVQCPEGVTIPTTGGISAVSYATNGVPFGWVSNENRWELCLIHKTQINTGVVAALTLTNLGSLNLSIPVGAYREVGFDFCLQVTHAGTAFLNQEVALSASNSSVSDSELYAYGPAIGASITEVDMRFSRRKPLSFTAMTPMYMLTMSTNANTTQYFSGTNNFGANRIFAIPAGL